MKVNELPLIGARVEAHPYLAQMEATQAIGFIARKLAYGGWTTPRDTQRQAQLESNLSSTLENFEWNSSDFLVQIGANDGCKDDPVKDSIRRLGMNALLVEPARLPFEALKNKYSINTKVITAQAVIGKRAGPTVFFVPEIPSESLNSTVWSSTKLSRVKKEITMHRGKEVITSTKIHKVQTESLTASDLLSQYIVAPESVKALITDTQGDDYGIVQSFIRAGAKPDVIFAEKSRSILKDRQFMRYLARLGYELHSSKKDILARL